MLLTSPDVWVWLKFAACAAVIWVAGQRLAKYGEMIAERTGLSSGWIGLVLVAIVTSLPELVNGITSVTLANEPNLAAGNIFGSVAFNLTTLLLVDLLYREDSLYAQASSAHALAAAFGAALIGLAGLSVLLGERGAVPAFGHVGLYTPFIFVVYLVAVRTQFHYERAQIPADAEPPAIEPGVPLRTAVVQFALASSVIVAAGTVLPFVAGEVADVMGWHRSFVGTLLIGITTALPELSVTVAAIRLRAIDLAFGNLLGSNLFNIAILAVDDLLFVDGPLLTKVSPIHAISAFTGAMMTALVLVGLLVRPRRRVLGTVGWLSIALAVAYLVNSFVLFRYGR